MRDERAIMLALRRAYMIARAMPTYERDWAIASAQHAPTCLHDSNALPRPYKHAHQHSQIHIVTHNKPAQSRQSSSNYAHYRILRTRAFLLLAGMFDGWRWLYLRQLTAIRKQVCRRYIQATLR